jgi:hypothetical protein
VSRQEAGENTLRFASSFVSLSYSKEKKKWFNAFDDLDSLEVGWTTVEINYFPE